MTSRQQQIDDIQLILNDIGRGAFALEKEGERLAEMEISIQNGNLTVYHTEVAEILKGKGVASALLNAMVSHARENKLKVIPLCPFVHAQFKKHPERYEDIWKKDWRKKQ